jgi:hypothetical protein
MCDFFILPHQDDEIGALGLIDKIKNKNKIYFIYLTRSPKIEKKRNNESINFLNRLNIKKKNIVFGGSLLKINDQQLYKNLELVFSYLSKFFQNKKINNIFAPSYEGGHPDHDSTFIILYKYFVNNKFKQFNFYTFPLYNSEFKIKYFFNFLSPLKKKMALSFEVYPENYYWNILKLPMIFSSQLYTMIAFYPYLIYHYLIRRRNYFEKINTFYLKKPHNGKLYYEHRNWNSWLNLRKYFYFFLYGKK